TGLLGSGMDEVDGEGAGRTDRPAVRRAPRTRVRPLEIAAVGDDRERDTGAVQRCALKLQELVRAFRGALRDDGDGALRRAIFGPAHGSARRGVRATYAGRAVSRRSIGAA